MPTTPLDWLSAEPPTLLAALDVQLELAGFLLQELHAALAADRLPEDAADHVRHALAEVSRARIELRAARADVAEVAS